MFFLGTPQKLERKLRKVGLNGFRVLSYDKFEHSEVIIFEREALQLYFVKDSRETLVDVSVAQLPGKKFEFCDIEIALGIKTVEEVTNETDFKSLDQRLREFSGYVDQVDVNLSKELNEKFIQKLKTAKRYRKALWTAKIEEWKNNG